MAHPSEPDTSSALPPHQVSPETLFGKFIVLEGIDGAGKNYVLETFKTLLCSQFPALSDRLITTAEPTPESEPSKQIEAFLKTSQKNPLTPEQSQMIGSLYIADRKLHAKALTAWQRQGKVIFSTRYDLSTYAYQGASFPANNRHQAFEQFYTEHAYNQPHGSISPTLTFFLDISSRTSKERIEKRADTRHFFEEQQSSFTETVIATYHEAISFLRQRDQRKIILLDGTQPVETICHQILTTLFSNL